MRKELSAVLVLLCVFCVPYFFSAQTPVRLVYPNGLALDPAGNLYISDIGTHRILKLDRENRLTVIAGKGESGFSGDGGPAVDARFNSPHDVTVDSEGNLLVADTFNNRIRRIDRQGVVTTIAADLNNPQGVAVDRHGNILIADTYGYLIRRVDRNGAMTTFAGTVPGFAGDGGPATNAQVSLPMSVSIGPDGSVHISDAGNSRIRRIASDGTIQTLVGFGGGGGVYGAGFTGDGGPPEKAKVFSATDVKTDADGNVYISDSGNNRIRVIRAGVITTLAGSGRTGFSGDGGRALDADLNTPQKIAIGRDGAIYIADRANNRIRKVDSSGLIQTVAGEGNPTGKMLHPGISGSAATPPASINEGAKSADSENVKRSGATNAFPAEHADERLNQARTRDQISDLTNNVAAKLPHLGSQQEIVIRNLIDEHLFGAMAKDKIPHAPLSNDFEFCRRIYLDLTGRIPTPQQLKAFVDDRAANKRDKLIDELLESQAWVDNWSYWYGDLFRTAANRIGNPAMKHFDQWLRQSLKDNVPYDRFVTEMLTASAPNTVWMPDAAPATFLARWHVPGITMYHDRFEDTADEIIVQSARLFLGINYQCISCHGGKGFLEKVDLGLVSKKRSDLWAMAAFFGGTRVRVIPFQDRYTVTDDGAGYDTSAESSVRLQRTGGSIQPTFILTGEKADLTKPLRPQFARMLTSHPQFARATANMIWKQFFGLGIVDPVDSFDMARQDPKSPPPAPWTVQPANADLLEALGADFAAKGFDLKQLMRTITRSSAYQLSSRFDSEWKAGYTPYFARKFVRLMTSQQVHDSISQATQVFGNYRRRDMVYNTDLPPIRFWTEAATPEDIGGEAKTFAQTFGLANREQFDRQAGGSILQAIMLMNSPFVTRRVVADNGSLVDQLVKSAKPSAEIVEELYLYTLARHPLPPEKRLAVSWIEKDRKQGAEDLQWSLLNKLDFVFNY